MNGSREKVRLEVSRLSTIWGILICFFGVGILLVEVIWEKDLANAAWESRDWFDVVNFGVIWVIGGLLSIWGGWLLNNPMRGVNVKKIVGWLIVVFGLWGMGTIIEKGISASTAGSWDIADGVFYLVPFICWEIVGVQGWLLNHPRQMSRAGKGEYKFQVELEERSTLVTAPGMAVGGGGAILQQEKKRPTDAPAPMDMGTIEQPPEINLTPLITFPDRNMEAAVRKAVVIPSGEIHQSDIEWLMALEASEQGISNITGLEYFTNLTDLSLWGNKISDITPISNLIKLTTLTLYLNEISDITPLANLTNLTYISLWNNRISDISPLVQNSGLGVGDVVDVRANPLNRESMETYIPQLQQRGVRIIK
ncbi:MAG TPA: leucine-rich repeat domain-containing protein [Dehalococcoidia bacterium]|nr:leucine-rich repeat domain-containing protein [Dehalococcoidia bacterium]